MAQSFANSSNHLSIELPLTNEGNAFSRSFLSVHWGGSMYMPPTWLPSICTGPQPLPNTDRVPAPASRRVQLRPHLAPTDRVPAPASRRVQLRPH